MAEPVCITCGESIGEPYRLNRLDDGTICPACRDRVLAALPPIFPSRVGVEAPATDPDLVARERDDPPAAS